MTPGSTRKSTLFVQPVEGFQGAAELTVGVLPGEFAATGLPATVNVGESVSIDITAPANAVLGDHLLTVQARGMEAGEPVTKTATITVRVATEVYEMHLPVVVRQ